MTIRGTDQADLEKFQAMRIEALEKKLSDAKDVIQELKEVLEKIALKVDLKEFEIVEPKN